MLRVLSEKKRNLFYHSMIGKELSVLFEKEGKDDEIKGFASNYIRVKTGYKPDLINTFTNVTISEVDDLHCVTDSNVCNSQMKSSVE